MDNKRQYTPEQLEEKRRKAREYYWKNADECRRKKREEADADREKAREKCAEYHKKYYVPKERKRKAEEEIKKDAHKRNSEYHKQNKEKIAERKKKYREDHPEIFESEEFKQKIREMKHEYYVTHKGNWTMTREKQDRANDLARKRRTESEEKKIEHREGVKEWQRNNPIKRKSQRLKIYGITLEQFNELLEAQGGKCAICGMSDTGNPKIFPFVDHCHSMNHVRGILCVNCNHGLGHFKDSPALLKKAARYVERNGLFGSISKVKEFGGENVLEGDDDNAERSKGMA